MIIVFKNRIVQVYFTTMNGDLEIKEARFKDTGEELSDEQIQEFLNENADNLWLAELEIRNKNKDDFWIG